MLKQTLALIGLTLSLSANAALVDAINALNPGDQYRVLFATSTVTNALSMDIGVYNTIANNDGITGVLTSGLGLTWKALASTPTVNARTNTGTAPNGVTTYIFNTIGQQLATSYSDLWDGSIATAVRFDQNGVVRAQVWSGSSPDGLASSCYSLGASIYPQCPSAPVPQWLHRLRLSNRK